MRVTQKDLDDVMKRVNGDRKYPELGYFYLMGAYGGWKFVQIVNESGGVRDVLPRLGYVGKRAMLDALTSYLEGRGEAETLKHYALREFK